MKIAFFTDTYLPQINGVAKTLTKFKDYMEKNNIKYKIFAPDFYDEESQDDDNIERSPSFKFILYPQCRLSVPNYFKIKKELDEFNPDIIHLVTEFNMGICGLTYAISRKIPVVSSYETNMSDYLQYYKLRFLEYPSWKYFKWFHNSCYMNYCPSNASVNALKEKGFNNVSLWERGIESDKFSPNLRSLDIQKELNTLNKLTFLYVGRISPEKDLHIFMDTAKRLNKKYSDKIHFVLVGDGPSLESLKEEAPENFTFTGFVKGDKLFQIYASCDIFLFTSPTETLGFVILEAMASGLAIVSCNSGGISDNLIDGFNGLACREKNHDDFYNACEKLIQNPSLRNELSKNARSFALEKDWDKTFDKLLESYEDILSKREMFEKSGTIFVFRNKLKKYFSQMSKFKI